MGIEWHVIAAKNVLLILGPRVAGLDAFSFIQSRVAVNSVILGDYQRPFEISSFISDVTAGFRLLNLKNDALRKKFDSLKYDLKKVEEVVYDISIRGLRPGT